MSFSFGPLLQSFIGSTTALAVEKVFLEQGVNQAIDVGCLDYGDLQGLAKECGIDVSVLVPFWNAAKRYRDGWSISSFRSAVASVRPVAAPAVVASTLKNGAQAACFTNCVKFIAVSSYKHHRGYTEMGIFFTKIGCEKKARTSGINFVRIAGS